MRLGADPDQLRDLSAALRAAARELDDVGRGLDRRINGVHWSGPDARTFQAKWRGCRAQLSDASTRCRTMARRLDHQRDEQLDAARPDGDPTPSASISAPSPFPAAEQRYVGGLDVRIGPVVATLAGEVALQDLGDGRTRVTLSEALSAGGAVGLGASAKFSTSDEVVAPVADGPGMADGRLRAGGVQRRSWEVEHADVDDLLARVAADRAETALPTHATVARLASGVLDGFVETVTGVDPGVDDRLEHLLTPPPPIRVETLAEVEASASGALSAFALAGAAGASVSTVRVGTATTGSGPDARSSRVVEWSSNTNATLTTTVLRRLGINLPDGARLGSTLRLELGDAPDGSPQLDVRVTAVEHDELIEVAARIELSDDGRRGPSELVPLAIAQLARGDVRSATATLGAVQVPVDQVSIVTSRGEISGRSGRAGVSVASGPGIGATLRGQRVEIERAPTIRG